MSSDPLAREVTLNYQGGSITMTRGNLEDLFMGSGFDVTPEPEEVTASVPAHPRTRVIGGPSTNVTSHSRTYKGWPTSNANQASGGKVVYLTWQNTPDYWTARVTGPMASLADFLKANVTQTSAFRTSRGTKYGPFNLPIV
jgi:hypothetical protein